MPRQRVYREYFPSCIERLFGGGKPRRIKARCFVPYTEAEEHNEMFLGPMEGAPNIDLNMTVKKDQHGKYVTQPDEGDVSSGRCLQETRYPPGTVSCQRRVEPQHRDDPSDAGPCYETRKLGCGCECKCSSSSSYSTASSSGGRSAQKPKILVLEPDGRYRAIDDEGPTLFEPKQMKCSYRKPILVVKEPYIDSEINVDGSCKFDGNESVVSHVDESKPSDGVPRQQTEYTKKKCVVLGYIMYDPDSSDQKPYVSTIDGKRILPIS